MNTKYRTMLLCGSISMMAAGSALAQTTDQKDGPASIRPAVPQGLEEIVVTARKREESLQDVPVSIAAVSQDDLGNNLANDLTKVAELAPQLMIGASSTGTGAVITMRGISSSPSNAGLDQSVAVNVDGVPFSRGRIIQAAVFDLDRVEVLQGPQALFFGKNSPAGVISLVSADPTDEFDGYVRAGYEFVADERYGEAAVSGPITETLKARLALRASKMEGWMRNIATPIADPITGLTAPGALAGDRQPNGHDLAGRLTLLWTPVDDFEANFKLTVSEKTDAGGASNTEPFCVGSTKTPVTLGTIPLPGADCQRNRVRNVSALAPELAVNYPYGNGGVPYYDSNILLASLTLNKDFENITLTSTTGYYDQEVSDADSYDWTPYNVIFDAEHENYKLFTQELRANTDFGGPFNFQAGVYFDHYKRYWFNAPDLFNSFNAAAGNYTTVEGETNSDGDSFSVFGQVRWNIFPTVELAAGARYTRDKKKSALENLANNAAAPYLYPQNQVLRVRYKSDNVSPEATLRWHPQPDQTLYVGYKSGYKAGGISNPAILNATETAETLTFDKETVDGFEIGYKADLFDNRLRVNLTAYHYTYSGLQVVAYDVSTINFLLKNAAKARTKGITGLFEWVAADGFVIDGSFGYNRARYVNFEGAQCYFGQTPALGCINRQQNLSGRPLNRAPDFTGNIGASYEAVFSPSWGATFSVNAAYSSSYETTEDYAPGTRQKGFWRLNAAMHLTPGNERLRLSLIGRNLTNSYYMTRSFGWSGSQNPEQFIGNFNRPREVAIQAELHF